MIHRRFQFGSIISERINLLPKAVALSRWAKRNAATQTKKPRKRKKKKEDSKKKKEHKSREARRKTTSKDEGRTVPELP